MEKIRLGSSFKLTTSFQFLCFNITWTHPVQTDTVLKQTDLSCCEVVYYIYIYICISNIIYLLVKLTTPISKLKHTLHMKRFRALQKSTSYGPSLDLSASLFSEDDSSTMDELLTCALSPIKRQHFDVDTDGEHPNKYFATSTQIHSSCNEEQSISFGDLLLKSSLTSSNTDMHHNVK